jgi:hypothetical protein
VVSATIFWNRVDPAIGCRQRPLRAGITSKSCQQSIALFCSVVSSVPKLRCKPVGIEEAGIIVKGPSPGNWSLQLSVIIDFLVLLRACFLPLTYGVIKNDCGGGGDRTTEHQNDDFVLSMRAGPNIANVMMVNVGIGTRSPSSSRRSRISFGVGGTCCHDESIKRKAHVGNDSIGGRRLANTKVGQRPLFHALVPHTQQSLFRCNNMVSRRGGRTPSTPGIRALIKVWRG